MRGLNKLFWKMILLGTILIIVDLLTHRYGWYISGTLAGIGVATILIAFFYKIIWRF